MTLKIENDIKLDYSDVLIRPKRSSLTSRNEVDLETTHIFKNANSSISYSGIGIMAANMDGVGTFRMAKELANHNMMTVITKQHTIDEWVESAAWVEKNQDRIAISIGTGAEDYKKLQTIINGMAINIKYICIDVANGYSEHFVEHCKRVREDFPHNVIIAGNVVTREMTEELILNGVDIVKVGIGPGCFSPGQKVYIKNGFKNIEDIVIGDKVLTHAGNYKKVINTFTFSDKKRLINVNGIKATPNHEFYVIHKKYRDIVNDDNIDDYAEWIEAKDLNKDYLLLKHK